VVGSDQKRLRDRQAECFRGVEVCDQVELRRPFDREVAGLGASQDLIDALRHPVVDDALRGAQPSAPGAVAITGLRDGAALAAAYPIAIFYGRPPVAAIVIAMGLNSVIGSVENIWMAEFRRQSRFKPEFELRMGSKVAGFLVAVGWALATHSYWALVLGITASKAAAPLLSYRLHQSRPRWDLSRRAELLRLSVWLLVGVSLSRRLCCDAGSRSRENGRWRCRHRSGRWPAPASRSTAR
jgi:polysaccharide biosynthesis protein